MTRDIDAAVERSMRRRATQEQEYREPDGACRHCDTWYYAEQLTVRYINIDPYRRVIHERCPECGNVIKAWMEDYTRAFQEFIADSPDEALDVIDSFDELPRR